MPTRAKSESQEGHCPNRDDLIHRSRADGKTYCGLPVDGLKVDVPRIGDATFSAPPVTCPRCKQAIWKEKIDNRVSHLNRTTARQRAFILIDEELHKHDTFSPKFVMEKAVIRALLLVQYGAKRFDFSDSKKTNAPAVCVFVRQQGKCHRCTLHRLGYCLHPLGYQVSPIPRGERVNRYR